MNTVPIHVDCATESLRFSTCPVLSVHGKEVQTSSFKHEKDLFEAADVQAFMVFWHETTDHNDAVMVDWGEVCQFYEELLAFSVTDCLRPLSSGR